MTATLMVGPLHAYWLPLIVGALLLPWAMR